MNNVFAHDVRQAPVCHEAPDGSHHCHDHLDKKAEELLLYIGLGVIVVGLVVSLVGSIIGDSDNSNAFQELITRDDGTVTPTYDIESGSVGVEYKLNF